ncbi:MAG: hypothetical protein AB7E95_10865 [Kiritimatiellales bacterium]
MMRKWISIAMAVLSLSVYADTTNTFTRAVDNNWSNSSNWDVVPSNWTDYSANLVFGYGNGANYWMYNNISGAKVASMTFTEDAAGSYSVNNNNVQFTTGNSIGDMIVNNSSYAVNFYSQAVFNWGTSGARYVRANNGDLTFGGIALWTSNDGDPNLIFAAKAGRTITLRDTGTLNPGSTVRTLTFQGDGTGGSFSFDSTISGAASYLHHLIIEDAATVNLNMTAGQIEDLTLSSGRVSYSKDNLSFGDIIFGTTGGGANEVDFNGHDNDFNLLTIAADAETNILNFEGTNAVTFADCSAETWLSTLVITNFEFGVDSLRFGTDADGLTQAQKDLITVNGVSGIDLDSTGYLVPEPTTISLLVISSTVLFLIRHTRCF